ncbi:MAG: 2Fe-2S iron-sulfur cluster-binding protein [Bdellovibrionota bacterium]
MSDTTKTLHVKGFFSPIEFIAGDNLLNTLNAAGVSIAQSCEGNGTCTTCRVFILKGSENCNARTEIEIERAEERGFKDNERLACQTELLGSVEIEIEK